MHIPPGSGDGFCQFQSLGLRYVQYMIGKTLCRLLTDAGEDPALTGSFAVGYAMGNILLTLIGPLCILLLS